MTDINEVGNNSETQMTHVVCPNCFAKNRVPANRLDDTAVCGKCKTTLLNNNPVSLDNESLAKYIRGNDQLVVVDFWASWCQPCIMMAPNFTQATNLVPTIRFAKLQTDLYEHVSFSYNIRSLPTMVAFKNGVEITRQSGLLSTKQIIDWLQSIES